jgi:MFS transporter, FSR family, fosmidomycin resistance protein
LPPQTIADAPRVVSVDAAAKPAYGNLAIHSVAHFFIDLYSSALSAFQPLLVQTMGLSLTQAGMLGGMLSFSSSVTQPAYGYLSDRYHSKLFTALAPAVAGLFISAMGLAPSYGWLLLMVFLGGAGIASFHPQGSVRATLGLESSRTKWMAVFISSGTLGLALGPAYFSWLATKLGLGGAAWGAVPGVIVTLILLAYLQEPPREQHAQAGMDWAPLRACWQPLAILYTLVFLRSILQITFAQFLPLYLNRERGFSLTESSWALTLYLASGAVGGFLGGNLADRFGGRAVILASWILSLPFLALFFFAPTPWLSLVGLGLGGWALLFTIPVNLTMAQALAPGHTGTISALMMGFAWGAAGIIFVPLAGFVAERTSLHLALSSLLVVPLVGAWLTPRLKRYGCD